MPSDKISLFLNPSIKPFRRFEYTGYIQKNLILSVFQKYGAQLKQGDSTHHYYWKDALILKAPQQEEIILIKFFLGDDHGNSRIDIYNLKSETYPTFIHEIIGTIRALSEEYDVDEMVSNDGIDFVSLKVLEENARLGKWIFSERKLTDSHITATPQKLLMLKDFIMYTTPVTKKKVVISYSKKDLAQIHTFIRYLKPLVADNLIEEPWYCTNLLPGDDWDRKIGDKFKEADIIFFMISEYLFATKYVQDHEIKNAIDRYNNGDKIKIVPIVLEFYDWRRSGTYNLQKFSALPYQLKPISDYLNPKIAWSTITTSVRDMIEKDLDPGREEIVSRDVQELLERQVAGKLDRNS
jgi:internalin A